MESLCYQSLTSAGACSDGLSDWRNFFNYESVTSDTVAHAICVSPYALDAWNRYAGFIENHFPYFYEEVVHYLGMSQYTPNRIRMPRERLTKVQSKARKIEFEIAKLDMEISELQRIRYALSQSLDILRD